MSTATLPTARIDALALTDPAFKGNPYSIYQRLRAEAPVCRVRYSPVARETCWLVTRYEDAVSVLRDHQHVANDRRNVRGAKPPLRLRAVYAIFGAVVNNMLGSDEPDHSRLRSLVHKAFTQKRVEELRVQIETLADELLHRLRKHGEFDLVGDFAVPIPTTVIAQMLGIPATDRERFRRMFNALLHSSATSWKGMASNMPMFFGFLRYLRGLVKQRRAHPQDDLISALVAAEEAGDKLDEDELVSMILLLLVAGFETTVNLIGNGALALLENPEQFELLRRDPSLVPKAVEEFLRYYSPLDFAQSRGARSEIVLGDFVIPAGDPIVVAIGSANRDESQFDRPDLLDITRDPNRHIAFGQGIHYCLGAFLARLEGQIAFRALLEACPSLRRASSRDGLRWRNSLLLRGLESLQVAP